VALVTKEPDVEEAEDNHLIKMAEMVKKEATEVSVEMEASVEMEEEAIKEEEEAEEAGEEEATSNLEVILIKNSNLIESVTIISFKPSHPNTHLYTLNLTIIYFDYRSKSRMQRCSQLPLI
jgi:hypothetical protein